MQGSKQLILTGSLGEVLRESAQTALSYCRSHADLFGIDPDFYAVSDIHVHIPAGAVPKEGPSAGVAITIALLSLLTGAARAPGRSLHGRALPVGRGPVRGRGAREAHGRAGGGHNGSGAPQGVRGNGPVRGGRGAGRGWTSGSSRPWRRPPESRSAKRLLQIVALDLPPQRHPVDAEDARGLGLVPRRCGQDPLYVRPLQVPPGWAGRPWSRCARSRRAGVPG